MLPNYLDIIEAVQMNKDDSNLNIIKWLYNKNIYLTEQEVKAKYCNVNIRSVMDFCIGVEVSRDIYRFDSCRTLYTLLKECHPNLIRRYDISKHRDNIAIHVDNFSVDVIIKLINTTYNIYRDKFVRTVMFDNLDIADIRSRNRELVYRERIKIEKYPIEDNKCWVDLKSMRFIVDRESYSLVDFVNLIVTNRPKSVLVTYNLIDVAQYNDPLEITQEEIDTIKRMEEEFLK
uniref:Uncharacterized protein n=1 Tax=Myoviridae sp. ctijX18 TaxID=2825154 RepID=A0A8S5USU6_9CAUD|nr:MAG TPA: hypothetical protein [Myoviridae sp. ctijX18]DAQ61264.1 MAG TPA: hypothetical protein [Caudoviricetes sp.]